MKKKHLGRGDIIYYIILYAVFGAFTILCFYPFYYLFINSISANDLSVSVRGEILWFPKESHFSNYMDVIKIKGLLHAGWISGADSAGNRGNRDGLRFWIYVHTGKMTARKFWYRFTVITMYFSAGIIPWYLTMKNIGFTNNFWAYVIPAAVQLFNIILVKTYVSPRRRLCRKPRRLTARGDENLLETDSALSKPILATVAIFAAVGQWNSFQDTLILMTEERYYTLQYILYQYIIQASSGDYDKNSGIMNGP